MTGTLHGVGVGPGDPELMTLRAVRTIAAADVIAFIGADGRASRACATAATVIPDAAEQLGFDMPMRADPGAGQAVYDTAADRIAARLDAGRDVAFLCEGDPLLYGSFIYLMERLQDRFPVEIVPGLPSFAACAAALRLPLARRTDSFGIVPGTLSDADLRQRIEALQSMAVIKVGRHRARLSRVLDDLDLLDRAMVVQEVSHPAQQIQPLRGITGDLPYFATVMISKEDPA
ncbi:MAG: precorrin-2 C(20)-methyltransferase [Minwuia sp.]|nr:precorrin-2 C(20)-methyltransferase [Minwuia sp.]